MRFQVILKYVIIFYLHKQNCVSWNLTGFYKRIAIRSKEKQWIMNYKKDNLMSQLVVRHLKKKSVKVNSGNWQPYWWACFYHGSFLGLINMALWLTNMIGFVQNFTMYWSLKLFKSFGHQCFCQLLLALQWQILFSVPISVGPNI